MRDRYAGAESTWQWELWNEPDIGYWHGKFDEFAQLYDHTEAALHAVFPNASLGGPAVASPELNFLAQFLEHCATGTNAVSGQRGTRLDMISFHAKGGVINTRAQRDPDARAARAACAGHRAHSPPKAGGRRRYGGQGVVANGVATRETVVERQAAIVAAGYGR